MSFNIIQTLQEAAARAVEQLYGEATDPSKVQVNPTPAGFSGDYSIVIFPFVKMAGKSPDIVAREIGERLVELPEVEEFNGVKGFLNLRLADGWWKNFLVEIADNPAYGRRPENGRRVMVEYSSPNTNKPLHLGHVRNILLGWSTSQLYEAMGYKTAKVQIINDRGVAICKSMLSWLKYGEGKTPENTGIKGDHFVGDYYVLFEQKTGEEYKSWQQGEAARKVFEEKKKPGQEEAAFFKEYKNKWFNDYSQLGAEVRDLLLKWENNDPEAVELWKQMNGWVYDGFDKTYDELGVSFDKLYYESGTYLLGKSIVEEGLKKGVFFKKPDGAVVLDLTDIGQDQKIMLRSDGTSMYITQDLGTARMRYEELKCDRYVYVVASEQDYHFQVLFEALRRLGEPYADELFHLSYGLVELPTGRMKTREGTVVDADDLIEEVVRIAGEQAADSEEMGQISEEEKRDNLRKIGLAALKFFMIKVHPRKKMIFSPEESVDLKGQTGPYIQYSFVRIQKMLQRAEAEGVGKKADLTDYGPVQAQEKELLVALYDYPKVIAEAAENFDPSLVANFCYDLAKKYHRFYHDLSVLNADTEAAKSFRLALCRATANTLQSGMRLLGIEMPSRM